jgi:hypothetical protein
LALDLEVLIEKGKVSLQEKQKLIDQALEKSFTVSLGEGKFGQCLVRLATLCDIHAFKCSTTALQYLVQDCF